MNDDSFSVGPPHPEIISLPTGAGLCTRPASSTLYL